MEGKQFQRRALFTAALLALLVAAFAAVLWNLQVTNLDYYRGLSTRKIANRETVEAARGEMRDRYGRVLVTNRAVYQVTLDLSRMGEEAQRNANLLALLEICREQKVEWSDTLPISESGPFSYTSDTALSYRAADSSAAETVVRTSLGKLVDALPLQSRGFLPAGETDPSAAALMQALRGYFEVDESLSDGEARALIGVLYEINLRQKNIDYSDYIFAQDVDIDFISTVKEHGLTGVQIEAAPVREYATSHAAHLLGRVGPIYADTWAYYKELGYNMNDTVGIDGAESAFEPYLRGEAGVREQELSTSGKVVSESWYTDPLTGETHEPEPGDNVLLTLDVKLQAKAEQVLADTISSLESADTGGGAVVIQDVSDGGVLTMASYPTYDLATVYSDQALYAQVSSDPLEPFYNRASMGLYSPGSTFKPLVGIAALEEGVTTPSETIRDTGRFTLPEEEKYPYGDFHPQCWIYRQYGGTHGQENLADALRDSCNIYFYTIGHRLGIERIDLYAKMFGLGEKTGFELSESKGRVAGPATSEALNMTWYGGNLLNVAIGQDNTACTPLQLTNYIATLVNGGNHYATHLLRAVKSSDYSQTVLEYEPQLLDTLELDADNVEAVKLGMWKVANDAKSSVSRYFAGLPVEVGAKTGSAQVASNVEADAVFVCFAPYDDPQIAMTIVVEGGASGSNLAQAAAEILDYYFSAEDTLESVDPENTLLR